MATPMQNQPLQLIQTRVRSGPTSTITQATSWQWYELIWALLVVALFATAGRVIDVIVAIGLVVAWLAGPAIVVSVAGHLAVIGLGIFPEVAWAIVAMEVLLIAPIIIELSLFAPSQQIALRTAIGIVGFSAITTIGVWISIPMEQLGILLGVFFIIGIFVLYIRFEYDDTEGEMDQRQSAEAVAESIGNAGEPPSAADGENK